MVIIKSNGDEALLGIWEIAELAGVSRQAVSNWRARSGNFPDAVANLHSGPVFRRKDIVHWLERRQVGASATQPPGKNNGTRRVTMNDAFTAGQLATVIGRFQTEDQQSIRLIVEIAKSFGARERPWAESDPSPKEYWLEFSTTDYRLDLVPKYASNSHEHFAIYCPREDLEELRTRLSHHLDVSADRLKSWNANRDHTDSQNVDISVVRSKTSLGALIAVIGWLAEAAGRSK